MRVWSEHEREQNPGEHTAWDVLTECTEAAYQMVMDNGGWKRFPLGAYTEAERDALDAAIGFDRDAAGKKIPHGGGNLLSDVDYGAMIRYGVALSPLKDGTRDGLRRALSEKGRGIVVTGTFGGFPVGHRLRRHQPNFTGGHAAAAIALGGNRVWWGDPLAAMNDPGDIVTVDEVMTFAWTPGQHFARTAMAGELVEVPDVNPATHVPIGSVIFNDGAIYADEDGGEQLADLSKPTRLQVYALPLQPTTIRGGQRRASLVPVRVDLLGPGREDIRLGWIGVDQIQPNSWQYANEAGAAKRMTDALTHLATIRNAAGTVTDAAGELEDALSGN